MDVLNVIRGRICTDAALTDVIPIHLMKSEPHLDFASAVRAETGMPTFHAPRIPDVATARHAIASGLLDMVGMTRAHIADPHIVRNVMARQEDAIRPCVGATYCLERIYEGGEARCIHNASTGRELALPHAIPPSPSTKRVVVGAGPGGLERGERLVVAAWDVLSGDVTPGARVLVWDDAGDHAGLQAVEMLADAGADVEFMNRARDRLGDHGHEPDARSPGPSAEGRALCRRAAASRCPRQGQHSRGRDRGGLFGLAHDPGVRSDRHEQGRGRSTTSAAP